MQIIGLVILLALFGSALTKIGESMGGGQNSNDTSEATRKAAYRWIRETYGKAFAMDCERSDRWETRNYTSGGWTIAGGVGQGIVPGETSYPYGWPSMKVYPYKDLSQYTFLSNLGDVGNSAQKQVGYIDGGDSIRFKAWFIQNVRDGDITAWVGDDPDAQAEYRDFLDGVTITYTL